MQNFISLNRRLYLVFFAKNLLQRCFFSMRSYKQTNKKHNARETQNKENQQQQQQQKHFFSL